MAENNKKSTWFRIVLTGIIWTVFYLQGMSLLYYYAFHFNPLILSEWDLLFQKFISGQWIINTFKDTCLFMSLILFVPLWLIGWWVCLRIRLGRYLLKLRTKRAIVRKVINESQAKKPFFPTKLRVQSSALLSVNPVADVHQHNTSSSANQEAHIPTSAEPVKSYSDEADIQSILPYVQGIPSVDFFPHISLGGHYASFALSTETKAAVVTLLNEPEGRWVIDTNVPLKQSDWYNETHVLPTPLVGVVEISEQLQKSDDGATALPIMVLMSGTILNSNEAREYLEKNGVILTRLDSVDLDDVPLFSDFLQFYFDENQEQSMDVSADIEEESDEEVTDDVVDEEVEIYEDDTNESDEDTVKTEVTL